MGGSDHPLALGIASNIQASSDSSVSTLLSESSSSHKSAMPLTCTACKQKIADDDLVHQVLDAVYHKRCFNCSLCARPLQTGEKFFGGPNRRLLCASHSHMAMIREESSANKMAGLTNLPEATATTTDQKNPTNAGVSPMSTGTTGSSPDLAGCAISPTSPSPASSTKTDSGVSSLSSSTTESATANSGSPASDGEKKDERTSPGKKTPGKRAARAVIKGKVLEILKNTFAVNPKPSRQVRERLCQETGLTMRTVLVWFQHRRSKERWMQSCMSKTDTFLPSYACPEYNQWLSQQYQQGMYPNAAVTGANNFPADMVHPLMSPPVTSIAYPSTHLQPSQPQQMVGSPPLANNFMLDDFSRCQPPPSYQASTSMRSVFSSQPGMSGPVAPNCSLSSPLPEPRTQTLDICMPVTSPLLSSSNMSSSTSMPSLRNQSLNQSMPSIMSAATEGSSSLGNSTPNLRNMQSASQSGSGDPQTPLPRYPSSTDSGLPEDLLSAAEDLVSMHGSQHSLFRSPPQPLTPGLDFPASVSAHGGGPGLALRNTTNVTQSQSDLLSCSLSQSSGNRSMLHHANNLGSTSNLSHLLDGLSPLDNCFENFPTGMAL